MKKIIKSLLYGTTILPFINSKQVFFSFISSKSLVFSLIVILSGILFLFEYFNNKSFKDEIIKKIESIKSNKIMISITAFVLLSAVSVIFAFDRYVAFWGIIERSNGLVQILPLFIYLILLSVVFDSKDWKKFFQINVVIGIFLGVFGIIEYINNG